MHPDLFQIGPLTVHSYGTLIVTGFLLSLFLMKLRVDRYGIAYDKCVDLSFGLLLAGFVGAKVFYWLIIPSGFINDMGILFSEPVTFLKHLGQGFEFFGGIVGGIVFFVYFTTKHKIPKMLILDLITPSIPLAHAFGRIGCFMAGCCHGRACALPWAVTFTDPHSLAPLNIALHPTQLYESFLLFILTAILLLSEKMITRVHGRMISLYILGYTIIRFTVEHFRGDNRGTIQSVNISGTQIISIIIAFGALFWLWHVNRKNKISSD